MQGMPIVQASSQAWAAVGSMWSSGFNSGWILDQSIGAAGAFTQSVSPASSGQGFYSTGDATAYYAQGRMLKVIDGGGTHYCEVLSSSSSAVAGTTTSTIVTITNVVSGTTTLSTGSLTSVSGSPIFATSGMLSNFGAFSTGSASFPGMRFRGSYGGVGLSVDGSTFLGFNVLGTEIFSMSTGALLGATDNTYDIGASGATRVRTGYFGTGIRLGTNPGTGGVIGVANNTLAISGRNALNNGDIDLIGIGSDNRIYLGGHFATGAPAVSMSTTVLFETDNANDIGASGATRPRRVFVAGFIELGGTGSTNNQFSTASTGAGTTTMYIGNASINVTSDRRAKKDIQPTTRLALPIIRKLPVVDFSWNDPSDLASVNRNSRGRWTGFVAQDVVDIIPWLVNAPDRKCSDCRAGRHCDKHEGLWRIDSAEMVGLLAKGLQELDKRISDIEEAA